MTAKLHSNILAKAVAGERLTFDDGLALTQCNDLAALGLSLIHI